MAVSLNTLHRHPRELDGLTISDLMEIVAYQEWEAKQK
jgi:hypothetical protein